MICMRILIIGAGPTGLGAAWRLKELGHSDFLVVERNDYVGGLAASFYDSKGFTWDFAVHVAHSHYHYVDRLFSQLMPDGFLTHERRSWVYTQETFVPFPFQYNFRHLSASVQNECLEGLRNRPIPSQNPPSSFEEWILSSVGRGIADHFMIPYNTKLWTVPPSAMSCQWLGDRIPEIDVERVRSNIRNARDDVSWGPNFVFQFPRNGGTGRIWQNMASAIGPEHIRLSSPVLKIDATAQTLQLSTGEILHYDYLISTAPLDQLVAMAKLDAMTATVSKLMHSRVQVVCVGLPMPIPARLRDKTWIYCPDDESIFYRVTPFSIYSPSHTPDPERFCSFMCEVATPGSQQPHSEAYLTARVLTDLNRSGLLSFPPSVAHVFHLHSDYGYPIPSLDRDKTLDAVLPILQGMNIWSRGRFGAWKYEVSNMDHSIMQGVEAVNRILRSEPEITVWHPSEVNAGKR